MLSLQEGTGIPLAFSFYWKTKPSVSIWDMHIILLFGEPEHSVSSLLNRALWNALDKTTHSHTTNYHKTSAILNLLLQ